MLTSWQKCEPILYSYLWIAQYFEVTENTMCFRPEQVVCLSWIWVVPGADGIGEGTSLWQAAADL